MEHVPSKSSSRKISIVGVFAVLTFVLTLPIAFLLSQEKQDVRSKAAEPTPSPARIQQTSGFETISGYIYYDNNKNGERDPGENSYPGVTIKVIQIAKLNHNEEQELLTLKADADGYFKSHFATLAPGSFSYKIKLVLPDGYRTINTNPLLLSEVSENMKQNIHFGLFPLQR